MSKLGFSSFFLLLELVRAFRPPGRNRRLSTRELLWCMPCLCETVTKRKNELAGKPGPVMDSHSSGMSVAEHLKQPTRIQHGSCQWIPIWSCSEWGLPCHLCCHMRGALLPHHFNLTGPEGLRRYIFCCTCHRFTPSRRYLALYPVEPGLSSAGDRNPLQRLPGQLNADFNTSIKTSSS